jgi:hypothetical protein
VVYDAPPAASAELPIRHSRQVSRDPELRGIQQNKYETNNERNTT